MERAPFGGRILTHLLFTRKASTRMQKRAPAAALILALFLMTSTGTVRADDPRETPLVKAIRARGPLWSTSTAKKPRLLAGRCRLRRHPQRARKINGMGPASSSMNAVTSSPITMWSTVSTRSG